MSTTSLKLSSELKERVVAVSDELGISTHAFMVGAISQATDAAEQRAEFVAQAQAALAETRETGLGYDADDVRKYLRERLTNPDTAKAQGQAMAKVSYTNRAVADLDRISHFLLTSNSDALGTLDLIDEAISILGRHPFVGRPAETGLHELGHFTREEWLHRTV